MLIPAALQQDGTDAALKTANTALLAKEGTASAVPVEALGDLQSLAGSGGGGGAGAASAVVALAGIKLMHPVLLQVENLVESKVGAAPHAN